MGEETTVRLSSVPVRNGLCLIMFFFLFEDMKEQFVYDPLISKRQQYLLATQVGTHYLYSLVSEPYPWFRSWFAQS